MGTAVPAQPKLDSINQPGEVQIQLPLHLPRAEGTGVLVEAEGSERSQFTQSGFCGITFLRNRGVRAISNAEEPAVRPAP